MTIYLELPHINKIKPYVPGKPIENLAREKNINCNNIIKLASNENPFGASPYVILTLKQNIDSINLYPDSDQHDFKNKLADFYNITDDMLIIGNGSDELIQMIMHTFVNKNNNVLAPDYSFISYMINTQAIGAEYKSTNFDNLLNLINNKTKLICIANPNNPTGTYIDFNKLDNFISQVPSNILILLDQAYYEYIKEYEDKNYNYLDLINKYPNLIITRTLSKAYGLAGLRVGYAIANPNIIHSINKIKLPFNNNRLVQFAAITALEDQDYLNKIITINNSEKLDLYKYFDNLNLNYNKSYTNFITLNLPNLNIKQNLYNKLLDNNIITRPLDNYELYNQLRITIGTPNQNKYLIKTLTKLQNLFYDDNIYNVDN